MWGGVRPIIYAARVLGLRKIEYLEERNVSRSEITKRILTKHLDPMGTH